MVSSLLRRFPSTMWDGSQEGLSRPPGHRLTVNLHGKVQANMKAREVLILALCMVTSWKPVGRLPGR